ncbi:hypothetical protein V6259_18010 [Marinomonas sp. TI.3.20]|uniref:hypothetical protein n=1 Tax=Marinomonas sp. TI.3.20 TaxID=3121296 RepID=UPI00311F63DF
MTLKPKQSLLQIREMQQQAIGMNDYQIDELTSGLCRTDLARFFEDTEEFFLDSPCKGLSRKAERSMRISKRWIAENSMRVHHELFGYGSCYTNDAETLHAFVHLSVDGCPRITTFDKNGFCGHSDYRDDVKIEQELYSHGMIKPHPKPNFLDDVFTGLYSSSAA